MMKYYNFSINKFIKNNNVNSIILFAFFSLMLSFCTSLLKADSTKPVDENTVAGINKTKSMPIALSNLDKSKDFTFSQEGIASCYGKKFNNRKTSNGERYIKSNLSAAHRKVPFGTILRITNLKNNKASLVRVNDRGPFAKGRIIDMSYAAAKEIDDTGIPKVKIEGLYTTDESYKEKFDENHYFGYSYDKPLVCLPISALHFLDSSINFDEAVKMYQKMLEDSPNKVLYLMASVDYTLKLDKEANSSYFYLAILDPEKDFLTSK